MLNNIFYTKSVSLCDDDPSSCVIEITGNIYILDEDYMEMCIGKVKYFLIDVYNSKYCPNYLLDLSSTTEPFINQIYIKNSANFRKKIENLSEFGICYHNLLILDRIEILPDFRGKNYSEKIIDNGARTFSHIGLIALKAFPLQFEYSPPAREADEWRKDMHMEQLEKDEKRAFKNLINYYKKIGFTKINSDNIMVKVIV